MEDALTIPGYEFSEEFKKWLLEKKYRYDLMRLHELYPDVPDFNYHPPGDEMGRKRVRDMQEFERTHKSVPVYVPSKEGFRFQNP